LALTLHESVDKPASTLLTSNLSGLEQDKQFAPLLYICPKTPFQSATFDVTDVSIIENSFTF
jgi:hypothetical protein